jgi:hypothetical protein
MVIVNNADSGDKIVNSEMSYSNYTYSDGYCGTKSSKGGLYVYGGSPEISYDIIKYHNIGIIVKIGSSPNIYSIIFSNCGQEIKYE